MRSVPRLLAWFLALLVAVLTLLAPASAAMAALPSFPLSTCDDHAVDRGSACSTTTYDALPNAHGGVPITRGDSAPVSHQGGPAKAANLAKFGQQLQRVRAAADAAGGRALFMYEDGTPQSAIDLAIKWFGPGGARPIG